MSKLKNYITTSGTWTVPKGVTEVDLFLVGGGASGARERGGGGGSGYTETYLNVTVTPEDVINVTIGAGGVGITSNGVGNVGGFTRFGDNDTYQAGGGQTGGHGSYGNGVGGAGGSGGGESGASGSPNEGGAGGYDGGDGEDRTGAGGGTGQGAPNAGRAFHDPLEPIEYAGGGGGFGNPKAGLGGQGGGGKGQDWSPKSSVGIDGTANTGGGGGGVHDGTSGVGGSGIMIIRYEPTTQTLSPTNVTSTAARLRGELVDALGEESITCYFQYREQGEESWAKTSDQTLTSEGVFSQDISGLSLGANYEFRAVSETGEEGSEEYVYGHIESFRTLVPWYNTDWLKRIEITVDKDKVSGSDDITNFPIYLDLAELPEAFFTSVRSDGGDIRITTYDGETEVPREVVSIDTGEEEGEVHFKGTLSHENVTKFYVYYGNATATNHADNATYGAENVWDSNYKGVWHKKNLSATTIKDSTENGNTGTKKDTDEPAETTGKIGHGQEYDGGNPDHITVTNSASLNSLSDFTIGGWIQFFSLTSDAGWVRFLSKGGNTWSMYQHNGAMAIYHGQEINPSVGTQTNTWYHFYWTKSGNALKLFIDNVERYSTTTTKDFSNTSTLAFGRNSAGLTDGGEGGGQDEFNGIMAEIRISNTARTSDYITTEYNNQNDPGTFYNIGVEEGVDVPPVVDDKRNAILFGMNF